MIFTRSPGAKPTILDRAVEVAKPAVITAMVFSFFINILALVSPLYMLQVYDRVLSSRNVATLVVLTLICIFLFIVYGLLEALRTQVLVRGGLKFDGVARDPIFRSVLDSTLTRRGGGGQAFRDMDQVREFMTGGLIAFCDAPWTPVFVIVSFMLHWYFGVLAIISCFIIFGLAVMNDRATKNPVQMATMASIAAQNDAGSTLRNAEVMKAMGMWGGLQARWRVRRDEQVAWQAAASDAGGAVMSGIKVFRQVVQTLILGGGAYLAIEGKISAGSMIAGSILVGRALAPIEGAVGQWKSLLGARSSWDRLQTMLRDEKSAEDHMQLPEPRGVLSAEAASIVPPGRNSRPCARPASASTRGPRSRSSVPAPPASRRCCGAWSASGRARPASSAWTATTSSNGIPRSWGGTSVICRRTSSCFPEPWPRISPASPSTNSRGDRRRDARRRPRDDPDSADGLRHADWRRRSLAFGGATPASRHGPRRLPHAGLARARRTECKPGPGR